MKKTPILCLFVLLMLFASCKKEAPELKKTTETTQSVRPPIKKALTDIEVGEYIADQVDYTESEQDWWSDGYHDPLGFAMLVEWDIRYPHLQQQNFPPLYHIQFGTYTGTPGDGEVVSSSFPWAEAAWSYEHMDGYVQNYTIIAHGHLVLAAENKTYLVTTNTTYRQPHIMTRSIIQITRIS